MASKEAYGVACIELFSRLWVELDFVSAANDSMHTHCTGFLPAPRVEVLRLELIILLDACRSARWRCNSTRFSGYSFSRFSATCSTLSTHQGKSSYGGGSRSNGRRTVFLTQSLTNARARALRPAAQFAGLPRRGPLSQVLTQILPRTHPMHCLPCCSILSQISRSLPATGVLSGARGRAVAPGGVSQLAAHGLDDPRLEHYPARRRPPHSWACELCDHDETLRRPHRRGTEKCGRSTCRCFRAKAGQKQDK